MKNIAVFVAALFLGGCLGVGGHWMNGDPSVAYSGKAYIEYWEKQGMTEERRLQDWLACGGGEAGHFRFWMEEHQLPGETDKETDERVNFEFQRCVLEKGTAIQGTVLAMI